MFDGWSDRKDRTLIHFLVNSPLGTWFIESIDASDEIKTGEKMYEILDKRVQEIGAQNIIQVVTDNASSLKLAGKDLHLKVAFINLIFFHVLEIKCGMNCKICWFQVPS